MFSAYRVYPLQSRKINTGRWSGMRQTYIEGAAVLSDNKHTSIGDDYLHKGKAQRIKEGLEDFFN